MTSRTFSPHAGAIFIDGFGPFLLAHQLTIIFVSALICLLFALMILLLRRSIRVLHDQKWALSFAGAFLVVGLIYFLRVFDYTQGADAPAFQRQLTDVIMQLGSGLSNYLFFISGFRLLLPASVERPLSENKKWRRGKNYYKASLLIVSCLTSLVGIGGKGWPQVPDAVVSVAALVFMGYMLYQNISYRRDRLMAWVALVSSISYALFYLLWRVWGMEYLAQGSLPGESEKDLLFFLLSLTPKIGLFLPAYSFMLILAAPFDVVKPLFERVTDGGEEFFDNGGLVKAIPEVLGFKRARLDIMLPGSQPDPKDADGERDGREDAGRIRVATYEHDSTAAGHEKGPRIEVYTEGTHYDDVVKAHAPVVRDRKGYVDKFMRRIEEAAVPVFFHQKVIACLSAERGEGKFTEADLSELERIATMISPCVQEYRELAALNRLGQELGQLQIEVKEYDLIKNVEDIVERVHNSVEAAATGISLEAGFSEHFIGHPREGSVAGELDGRLRAALDDEDGTDEKGRRWLAMPLKILIETEKVGQPPREQPLGKLIFGAEMQSVLKKQLAVGTNPAFRQALSDLVTDTLLDFIRGYLNHLTDMLGIRLGRIEGADVKKWWEGLEGYTKASGLSWVVAEVPGGKQLYGADEAVELVRQLRVPGAEGRWEKVRPDEEERFWLCTLAERQAGVHAVVRRSHANTGATLWFGVPRRGFGAELRYVSPWRYFLDHFCQIAFSALLRIQILTREERRNRHLALLHSIMSDKAGGDSIIHDMTSRVKSLKATLDSLYKYVKRGKLVLTPDQERLLSSLRGDYEFLEGELESLADNAKRNNSRPCLLDEVLTEVCQAVEQHAANFGIVIERPEPSGRQIDVPYHLAKYVVKTVIDNAVEALQEALRKKTRESGRVTISVSPNGHDLTCVIADNGPGVPPDVRATLLHDVTQSSKKNSKGYGLYLSRAWLRSFEGDIAIQPQAPDTGAEFHITFPKK